MFEHVTQGCQCEGKKCNKCEEVKCEGMFDVRREQGGRYIYLRKSCKECRREQHRERWQRDNEAINARRRAQRPDRRDVINAQNRASRMVHGQKYNERRRKLRASHPIYAERVRAQARASHMRHRETVAIRNITYRQKNLERLRAYDRQRSKVRGGVYRKKYPDRMHVLDKKYTHRRRSLKKNVSGEFTPAQIREQLQRQRYRCYYLRCGQSKFPKDKKAAYGYTFTIEHIIPLNRIEFYPRNDMSNIVLVCTSCNSSKRDKLPHEWVEGGRLF